MTTRIAIFSDLHGNSAAPVRRDFFNTLTHYRPHYYPYEGWAHFHQGREAIEREFASAPEDIRRCLRWLPIGSETVISA